jgi:hypothetical protein
MLCILVPVLGDFAFYTVRNTQGKLTKLQCEANLFGGRVELNFEWVWPGRISRD